MSVQPTHVAWQRVVTDLLHALGYEHLHVRRTIGRGKKWVTATNINGWPDIWAWHPERGFVGLELKVGKDTPTPEQVAVLSSLVGAGARAMIAYPKDLDALAAMLSDRPGFP